MKIIATIARFLLGFIFLVFALNGFLHFIPASLPSGTAGQFVGALFVSNYLVVVFLLQLVAAGLLLINRFVPLALVLLAPIVVNIVAFHLFLESSGLTIALVVLALELYLAWAYRKSYCTLLTARATVAEAAGNVVEARGLYAKAAASWSSYGSKLEHAAALLGEARCLIAAHAAGADVRLRQSRGVAAELGAIVLTAEADALLDRVPNVTMP